MGGWSAAILSKQWLKLFLIICAGVLIYLGTVFYSVFVGQSQFSSFQQKLVVGMGREDVLVLAESNGYLSYETASNNAAVISNADRKQTKVVQDVFYFENVMLPSVVVVEYGDEGKVMSIKVDR